MSSVTDPYTGTSFLTILRSFHAPKPSGCPSSGLQQPFLTMGAPRVVTKTNPVISISPHLSQSSSMHQTLTWFPHPSPYKSALAHLFTHFLSLNDSQTPQSLRFWCSSPRLTLKSKFLVNCEPVMSPRTPSVGVVDFGEEVSPQPRDTGKRDFLVFLRTFASRIFDAQIASWEN